MPIGDDQHRLLIRVPREAGGALATALHQAAGRALGPQGAPTRCKVVLDPAELF